MFLKCLCGSKKSDKGLLKENETDRNRQIELPNDEWGPEVSE